MMNVSKELLEKAKGAKTAEELLAIAEEEGVELTAEQAAKAYAELHKEGELTDEELDNVAGGCGNPESSGDTPKYHVGQKLAMVHPVVGRYASVKITYVSSVKSIKRGVSVFTYNADCISTDQSYTDIPEFDFCEAEWVK